MFMIPLGVIGTSAPTMTVPQSRTIPPRQPTVASARHSTGILPPAMVTMRGYNAKVPVVPGAGQGCSAYTCRQHCTQHAQWRGGRRFTTLSKSCNVPVANPLAIPSCTRLDTRLGRVGSRRRGAILLQYC
jgi:hypothetical protein